MQSKTAISKTAVYFTGISTSIHTGALIGPLPLLSGRYAHKQHPKTGSGKQHPNAGSGSKQAPLPSNHSLSQSSPAFSRPYIYQNQNRGSAKPSVRIMQTLTHTYTQSAPPEAVDIPSLSLPSISSSLPSISGRRHSKVPPSLHPAIPPSVRLGPSQVADWTNPPHIYNSYDHVSLSARVMPTNTGNDRHRHYRPYMQRLLTPRSIRISELAQGVTIHRQADFPDEHESGKSYSQRQRSSKKGSKRKKERMTRKKRAKTSTNDPMRMSDEGMPVGAISDRPYDRTKKSKKSKKSKRTSKKTPRGYPGPESIY